MTPYTNKAGYPVLVALLKEDDNPAFGVPISVDLEDWLSPKAAKYLWDKGFIMPRDFIEKFGIYETMLAAVRIDYPQADKKACILKANNIIEAIRFDLM